MEKPSIGRHPENMQHKSGLRENRKDEMKNAERRMQNAELNRRCCTFSFTYPSTCTPGTQVAMHPNLSDTQLAELKSILEDEKTLLERAINRARKDGPVKLDQQAVGRISRMDALMNEGLARGSISRAHEEIGLVHAALDRIDGGTYGFCQTCKQPIDPKRLFALPETLHCTGCRN